MNSLSWLLYAAEVTEGIKGTVILFAVVGGFALVFSWMPFLLSDDSPADWGKWLGGLPRRFGLWVILACLVFVALPSKNTIMLIAASEVGETVLSSTQAQQIGGEAGALATDSLRVLRKFINDQLEEANEPK